MAQHLNLAGGGQDAFGQQAFAQHGIEKGGLAGVEFADDHQQEDFVQLMEGAFEQLHICVRRVKPSQQDPEILQECALAAQQLILFRCENALQNSFLFPRPPQSVVFALCLPARSAHAHVSLSVQTTANQPSMTIHVTHTNGAGRAVLYRVGGF